MLIFVPEKNDTDTMDIFKNPVLTLLTRRERCTIPQAAEWLDLSIGTVTKLMGALIDAGYVEDLGPAESASGRKPHLYGLRADAGYFLGLDINDRFVNVGLLNFRGGMQRARMLEDYDLYAPDAYERLVRILKISLRDCYAAGRDVKGVCACLPGRVNTATGESHSFFSHTERTLQDLLQEEAGIPLCLCNDTRAMTYGELLQGAGAGYRDILFLNVNWGLGLGIVVDGRVYGGKSGYAGEFGHMFGYDNQIICRCGKRGCIETEISGQALQRQLVNRIRGGETSILSERVLSSDKPLLLREIMDAVAKEDVLCIDAIEQIGIKLGQKTSGLINLFNPELIVVGGELAMTGDYLLNPMRMAVNKHAIQLVSQDTRICRSALGMDAGLIGTCLVARSRYIGEAFEC